MKINSLFRLWCYMSLTSGLCICFLSILWYSATSDSLLNDMYIQNNGINASHEVFRWGMLIGMSTSMIGGTPLIILILRKWNTQPNKNEEPSEIVQQSSPQKKPPPNDQTII